ncbi:MAG: TauD/TfdA family dioxygenase [Pseudomonadota bacterium]
MQTRQLSSHLGVEVSGVDVRQLDDTTTAELYGIFVRAGVLCIREQRLTPEEFLGFARRLGTPIVQIYSQFNLPDFPEIGLLTSEDSDSSGSGKRKIRGTSWHTDASYYERPPKVTILNAQQVPAVGGDTQFASTSAAFAALDGVDQTRLKDLKAVHNYQSSRSPRQLIARSDAQVERFPEGTLHPLVRRNPDSGSAALYLNPIRIENVDGLPRAESDALLDRLLAHCLAPAFTYRHHWSAGDLLLWDNRSILHQANDDYDWRLEKRRLMRIMLEGEVPQPA